MSTLTSGINAHQEFVLPPFLGLCPQADHCHSQMKSIEEALLVSSLPDVITQEASTILQDWYLRVRSSCAPECAPTHQLIPHYLMPLILLVNLHVESARNSVWPQIPLPPPVAPPLGSVLFAAKYKNSPATYFGVFACPISTNLSLAYQKKRRQLNVSNARSNNDKSESRIEYQFYELDSLIDAFIRGDLFSFINIFPRRQGVAKACPDDILASNPIFDEIDAVSDYFVTSSLMLAASGWLTSGLSQKLRGKAATDLFAFVEPEVLLDVCNLYLRCLQYATTQTEDAVAAAALVRGSEILLEVIDAISSRDSVSILANLARADKEIEPTKPFNSILPMQPDQQWMQTWSAKIRLSLLSSN